MLEQRYAKPSNVCDPKTMHQHRFPQLLRTSIRAAMHTYAVKLISLLFSFVIKTKVGKQYFRSHIFVDYIKSRATPLSSFW